jgi:hypothetical protein
MAWPRRQMRNQSRRRFGRAARWPRDRPSTPASRHGGLRGTPWRWAISPNMWQYGSSPVSTTKCWRHRGILRAVSRTSWGTRREVTPRILSSSLRWPARYCQQQGRLHEQVRPCHRGRELVGSPDGKRTTRRRVLNITGGAAQPSRRRLICSGPQGRSGAQAGAGL